jgi:hypothetical protein
MTFDRKFFEFQGSCSYLLAQDFVDRNFSLVITYSPNSKMNTYELAFLIGKQVVQVNVFDNVSIRHNKREEMYPIMEAFFTAVIQIACQMLYSIKRTRFVIILQH